MIIQVENMGNKELPNLQKYVNFVQKSIYWKLIKFKIST